MKVFLTLLSFNVTSIFCPKSSKGHNLKLEKGRWSQAQKLYEAKTTFAPFMSASNRPISERLQRKVEQRELNARSH